MSITNLSHIKKLFGRGENPEDTSELYKEMLLMTLARATRADLVTDNTEIAIVQKVLKDVIGEDVSSEEIRVAAASEVYETAPIEKHLERVGQQIDTSQRQSIVQALVDVFEADGKVTATEIDFFNMVVNTLKLSPAQIVGLVAK